MKFQRGQTLLEVLLVAGVMSFLMVILVSMSSTSVSRNKEATQKTVATQLAQEGMEWVQKEKDRIGWTQIRANVQNGKSVCLKDIEDKISGSLGTPPCTGTRKVTGTSENYYRMILFSYIASPPSPDTPHYEVTVEVDWDKSAQQEPVRLEGKIYEE